MKSHDYGKDSLAHRLRDKNNRPAIFHPTIPGAVGSMESPYRDGRDTVNEAGCH
jgi:hypothetical protein